MGSLGHLTENYRVRAQFTLHSLLSVVLSDLLCARLASLMLAIRLLVDQGYVVSHLYSEGDWH